MATFDRADVERVIEAVHRCPPLQGDYAIDDYVLNVALTVLDFQLQTVAVERARAHFEANHGDMIKTHGDLKVLLAKYPDTEAGNTDGALIMFGYRLWTRVGLMRQLLRYFEDQKVTDQSALREWAERSEFKRDFEGRVRIQARGRTQGLGIAVYNWLVMRQRVPSIKPDVHVTRFFQRVLDRGLNDQEIVSLGMEAAKQMGVPAHELDWRIWESERARE